MNSGNTILTVKRIEGSEDSKNGMNKIKKPCPVNRTSITFVPPYKIRD